MISKTIIFDNELEFRKYILKNNINVIYLSKDVGDNIIFFYGFSNDFLIAAKIREIENYNLYENIYNTLSNELNFSLITDNDYIKLKKHL